MKVLIFSALSMLAVGSYADVIERWVCKDRYSQAWKTIVTAEVLQEESSGIIRVAGVAHQSRYKVLGFNRRWDFGLADDATFDYAFVLKPNGEGAYYDFSSATSGDSVGPSQQLSCQQSSLNKESAK